MINLWISDIKQYKLFLAIKKRYEKYWLIWISRCEWIRFWLTERKLRTVIKILESTWLLIFEWKRMTKNWFKCNIYKLSDEFIEFLEKVREFTKPVFTYIKYTPEDVIEYVSSFAKKKYNQWKFDINWIKYVVNERWKWRWKILDTQNQKIVSLITIKWIQTS